MPLVDIIKSGYDGVPSVDMPKPRPMVEVGVTGLLRTRGSGIVFEEWLSSLSSYRQRQVYREMRDNDAAVGAMMFALEMLLRRAEWSVEAAKANKQGEMQAQFVRDCMEDMSHTWPDFISEIFSMFTFGFSAFETVYKRRLGPQTGKRASSKFSDGLIGWKKMAPRAQESILYWCWDDDGNLTGLQQLAAPDYKLTPIPSESLLLFRTTSIKDNPEGRSLLRNCFRAWTFKKRLEEVIGIGVERDICGMPVLKASKEAIDAMGGMAQAEKKVTSVRMDDQMGAIIPAVYDERGNSLCDLQLMKASGAKSTDAEAAIKRHNSEMFQTILAGFIEFGQVEHGSHSLHISATQIFSEAIAGHMDSIAAVINREAIPRLIALNPGMDMELCPKLIPGEIGIRDLGELSSFVLQLSQAGMTFFDAETQAWIRKTAKMPQAGDDARETHELPLDVEDEVDRAKPAAAVATDQQEDSEHVEAAV